MWTPKLQVEILAEFVEVAQPRSEKAALRRLRRAWDRKLYLQEADRINYWVDKFLRLRPRKLPPLPKMRKQAERSFRCPVCHSRSTAHRCPGAHQ